MFGSQSASWRTVCNLHTSKTKEALSRMTILKHSFEKNLFKLERLSQKRFSPIHHQLMQLA